MNPEDPRHGTNAGHRAHVEHGVPFCQPCRDAHAAYQRNRRARHYLAGVTSLRVPPHVVVRRIRALQAIGWDLATIGRQMGYQCETDQEYRARVWNILGRPKSVNLDTARRVIAVYDALSGTPGPSKLSRNLALKNGWLPPLAWDDIDNPDEQPQTGAEQRRGRGISVEDAEWMADNDETLSGACARLGIQPDSLRAACSRVGRLDVYDRLADREPNGEMSRTIREMKRGAA